MKRLHGLALLICVCVAFPVAIRAQEQKETPKSEGQEVAPPKKETALKIGNMTMDELRKALGLSVYVQGGYLYNTRNPSSHENDNRLFDHKANSFTLDLAQIRLQVGKWGRPSHFHFWFPHIRDTIASCRASLASMPQAASITSS